MAQFSGAVKLADLNDYLAPSQNCIKPILDKKKEDAAAAAAAATAAPGSKRGVKLELEVEIIPSRPVAAPLATKGGHFDQIKLDKTKQTATVSLQDCLACSGCVTSAETVLVSQQSTDELYRELLANQTSPSTSADPSAPSTRVFVASISPQSRQSLSHYFGLSPLIFMRKLVTFLRSQGFTHIFDTNVALDLAMIEAQEEFIQRWLAHHPTHSLPPSSSSPSLPSSSSSSPSKCALPILSSECPGWICYAEKTQGSAVLPHISTVKSPQSVLGSIIKRYWSRQWGVSPDSIYHVTIMPCYDKKLEGSRDDFYYREFNTRETDCVLTSAELMEMIEESAGGGDKGSGGAWFKSAKCVESELNADHVALSSDGTQLVQTLESGGSGGYVEQLFRHAASRLFGVTLPLDQPLPFAVGRNPDMREVSLTLPPSLSSSDSPPSSSTSPVTKAVLTFATAYGFRNIQNIVNKIKTRTCKYDYVEIMACPSGCLNGGGQITAKVVVPPVDIGAQTDDSAASLAPAKPSFSLKAQRLLIEQLDYSYHHHSDIQCISDPRFNPILQRGLYASFFSSAHSTAGPAEPSVPSIHHIVFHTQYRDVKQEDQNPLAMKW